MFRRTGSGLVVAALLLTGGAVNGCSSIVGRFAARSMERIFDSTEAVPSRVASPIRDSVGLSVLWVGHATMLIQVHDKVILTDPVFTSTVGLLAKRGVDPGLDISAVTRLDLTLISHIHFDHLSYGSLGMLPTEGRLVLPPGGADYTPEFGFAETIESRTWETIERDGMRITAVPVKHFSGRYGFDILWKGASGYTGYVVEYRGVTLFFAGDTGYDPEMFKEVGRRYRIDVAFIPIAPIQPREFMRRVHADPSDALQIFADTKASRTVAMHFRTFFQGLDPSPFYAQELLADEARARGLEDRVLIFNIGEQRVLIP
jgi:N-acyl-phosphatidylethanolamine-hydrolysing phospholipase D